MRSKLLSIMMALMLVASTMACIGTVKVSAAESEYVYSASDGTGKKPHVVVYNPEHLTKPFARNDYEIEADWSLCMNRDASHPGSSYTPGGFFKKVVNPSLEQLNGLHVPSTVTSEKYQQMKRVLYYYIKNDRDEDVKNGNLEKWRGLQFTFWSLEESSPIAKDSRYSPDVDQF